MPEDKIQEVFSRNLDREVEFMRRLGEAITTWHGVDGACYELYAAFMKGANKRLISISFFHLQSFEARLLLLDRCAFFMVTDDALKERWKGLKKRAEKQMGLRNQLAHSAFVIEGRAYEQTPILQPSFFDATAVVRKRAMNPDYRIDTGKLYRARHDFEVLADDLRRFRDDLAASAKKTARTN